MQHWGFGNPTPVERMRKLLEIALPVYMQISLEGLEEYKDHIRGQGHFIRSLTFLEELRSLNVGLDVFTEKGPFCFESNLEKS